MTDPFDQLIKSRFIDMFGDIRTNSKGLKCHKLGELGSFKTGGTPSSKHEEYYQGTIPFISTPALGPNYIDDDAAKYHISEEAIENCATALIPAGSLIIGTRINVGQSSINKIPMCTNQDIVSMMDIDKNYDLLFLKHCLNQYISYLDSQKKGATIKGITVELLKSLMIPEPSIEEQKQYADFVEQVDKSKAIYNQLVSRYDDLIKSRFIEMFGSVTKTIKMSELGSCRNGLNFSRSESGHIIQCIGVGDFQSNMYTDQIPEIPTIMVEKEPINQYLENGDIVFVRSNGNRELIGRSMLARNIPEKTSFSGFCISFHNESKEILSEFLIYYLHQDLTKQKLFSKVRGANISNLTQEMLGSLEVPVSPIDDQMQFIDFVQQVNESKVMLFDNIVSKLISQTS